MDNFWEQIKKQIFATMKAQDVNKAELARRLGWQAPIVNRTLGSEEKPSDPTPEPGLDKLAEIAAALNTSLADLIQKAAQKNGPKAVHAPPTRDSMLVKLFCELCEMSNEEIQTVSNSVRLMREKLAAKRGGAGKKSSQAG